MDREGWQDQKIKLEPVQTKVDKGINKIIQVRTTKLIRKQAIGLECLTKDMTLKIQINAEIAWSISPMYNARSTSMATNITLTSTKCHELQYHNF